MTKPKVLTPRIMAPRCAAIPGLMRGRRDLPRTRSELAHVLALADAHDGIVPRTEKDPSPDALANLFFLRAIHEFGAALAADDAASGKPDPLDHAAYFLNALIPAAKKILQKFVSGDIEGTRMDDGGLLTGGPAVPCDLRINALWYNALEMTANMLKDPPGFPAARDLNASHHFDRLAGRFRRSFVKAYWCADHNCVCPPRTRELPDHGKYPDPDQLLIAFLPASPLPRTKQRQILGRIHDKALGDLGVKLQHPEHGIVESPLHRVWLARGYAVENAEGRAKAASLLTPLARLHDQARKIAVHTFYKSGHPAEDTKPDPLTSTEVFGALEEFEVPKK